MRLLISAGKVDKRKTFFKTLDKIGTVESFAALVGGRPDWAERAEVAARTAVRERKKEISEEALAELVSRVGPNARQLENEIEKLCLFAGDRKKIEFADVAAICSRNKTARAFALGDALGDRDLPRLLQAAGRGALGNEIRPEQIRNRPALRPDRKSARDAAAEGNAARRLDQAGNGLQPVQGQLERVPAEKLPADRRFNPLALNPYVLYKALPQVKKYSQGELVRAMDLLLRCNQRLVSSGLDETLVLQQTLVQIVAPQAVAA